jgi:hypothetical protein
MQYSTFDDLQRIAITVPAAAVTMSRRQRLERWANLLEQDPHRPIKLLR